MQILATIEYTQGREIGAGQGMNSRVFLVDDPQLGGRLAVKEIPKASFVNASGYWDEARAMFGASHDFVVPIRYACQTADLVCLAMPYFQRGSLTDRIQAAPLRPAEVIRIGQGILAGLAQIHIAGHLHFDLKPSNVLFSDQDQPMVADFGQARAIGPNGVTLPPARLYRYGIPPELFTHGHGTVASDVFQAGLTLYRAVNGEPFYQAQLLANAADIRTAICTGIFPDRDEYLPHVTRAMRQVIRKALQLNSADRYGSAREFATALGRVMVTKDWSTTCQPSGEIEWRCQQAAGHQLVVRQTPTPPKWKVTIHNEKPGTSRVTKRILWKDGLTQRQAQKHLQQVFAALD